MQRYKKQIVHSEMPLVKAFSAPGLDAKPMARMWFPDAGAGENPNDCIETQLRTMAEGGMGGVEIALLADGTGISSGEKYGWGTPNWTKTLKKVMKAARGIEGGFKVDFTISPHWPPNIFTIDPNDTAASSDLYYAYRKVTKADIAAGSMEIPMPEVRLYDQKNNPFIFKSTFVGASVAKVSDMPRPKMRGFKPPPEAEQYDGYQVIGALPEGVTPVEERPAQKASAGFQPPEGMEFIPEGMRREDIDWSAEFEPLPWRSRAEITLQFDSLRNVTTNVYEKKGAGWPCGVPDGEALERWYEGKITVAQIEEAFGPPADENAMRPDGKRDQNYLRKRMADWQSVYELSLTDMDLEAASEGEALRTGDTIVIGFFYRGSGQQLSGGGPWKIMPNQTYVTNYLIPEGVDAITDYWNDHILSDPELRQMIEDNGREVGGSIFEDSIELHTYGAPWGRGFEKYIPEKMGYPIGDLLPVLAGFATDDLSETRRITQDFAAAVGKLYKENRVKRVSDWAKSFHYNFRAQAYSLGGLGITEAALATDVTEGDNSTYDDALRQLQTAVNVKPNEKFLSMESNTFNKFGFIWKTLIREVHWNASSGVNRVIFHGTAYPKTESGYMDWWPGWNWGEKTKATTFMAWDQRNPWWDNAHAITDYLSRLQTVFQEGKRTVELAILPSMQMMYELGEGNSHQRLLDRGYSYNLLDEHTLALENCIVRDGRLFPDGPAYRALVLADCDYLHEATLKKILELAQQGLPIVIEGIAFRQVFGLSRPGNRDRNAKALLEALKRLPNVFEARDDAELDTILVAQELGPAASYDQKRLECSHVRDGRADYYCFFNANEETVTTAVSLSGSGVPVFLNCWNGKLEAAAEYTRENGKVSMSITLAGGDMIVLGVLPDVKDADRVLLKALPERVIDSFSLKLVSFGPAEETDPEYVEGYPTTYHKTTLCYDAVQNGTPWSKLPAGEETLKELRVSGMADVSGVGIYQGTVTLPEGTVGGDLKLSHFAKSVPVEITVNGKSAGVPNCMTEVLPLDGLVHGGVNQIEIKVASTLDNRCYYNDEKEVAAFPPEKDIMAKYRPPFPMDFTVRYPLGLYSAAVVPYYKEK